MSKFAYRFMGLLMVLGIAAWSFPGVAAPITDDNLDPLNSFCYGASTCWNNGGPTLTVPSNPLQFGFSISPGPNTGDFSIYILIPNNEDLTPSSLSYTITVNQGGAADNAASFSETSSLFSTTVWKSGTLTAYLGLAVASGVPVNGIVSWLPTTQVYDPAAIGYYAYRVDLGTNELRAPKKELLGPLLSLDQLLPEGALIVGFLDTSAGSITTTPDGALLMDSVAEPRSLAIFGMSLLLLAAAYRCKRS